MHTYLMYLAHWWRLNPEQPNPPILEAAAYCEPAEDRTWDALLDRLEDDIESEAEDED